MVSGRLIMIGLRYYDKPILYESTMPEVNNVLCSYFKLMYHVVLIQDGRQK